MRRAATLLALVAALALTAGCGPHAGTRTQPATGPAQTDPDAASAPPIVTGAVDPRAVAVARDYALAARGWTPGTLRAQWRRSLALSTDPLRATVRQAAPAREDVDRARADRARSDVTITQIATDAAEAGRVTLIVTLAERITVDGRTTTQTTRNEADVVRRHGAWRVSAFTLAP